MADGYNIQYDEHGRAYLQPPGQPRNYISPAAFGQPIGGNEESSWRSGPQWNQHTGQAENPFKWGKLLNVGVGAGLGAGVASAAGLFGGAASSAGSSAGGLLPSSAVQGAAGGMLAGAPTATAGISGAGGGMGLGGILGGVKKGLDWLGTSPRDVLGGLGAGMGAASQGQAQNRDAQLSAQLLLEKLLMDRDQNYFDSTIKREEEGRASQSDAWKKLMSAQHFQTPNSRPSLSPYSRPAAARGDQGGANALAQEAMLRLQGGNTLPMPERRDISLDPNLMNAGGLESTLGWLSPFLTGLGQQRPRPQVEPR